MRQRTDQEIAAEKDSISIIVLITLLFAAFVMFSGFFNVFLRVALLAGISFSFVVARLGRERKIGYVRAFLVSSFFSPVIGLLITLSSPRIEDEEYKEKMLLAVENNPVVGSIADELHKLNELRKEGILTNEEFEMQKERLLNP